MLAKGQTDHSKARKEPNFVGGIRFPLVQKSPLIISIWLEIFFKIEIKSCMCLYL